MTMIKHSVLIKAISGIAVAQAALIYFSNLLG